MIDFKSCVFVKESFLIKNSKEIGSIANNCKTLVRSGKELVLFLLLKDLLVDPVDKLFLLISFFCPTFPLILVDESNSRVFLDSLSFSASWLRCRMASALLASNSNFGFNLCVTFPSNFREFEAGFDVEEESKWTGWVSFTFVNWKTSDPIFSFYNI